MIIFLLNHLTGILPDVRIERVSGKYWFVYKTSFWGDALIGLTLELCMGKCSVLVEHPACSAVS